MVFGLTYKTSNVLKQGFFLWSKVLKLIGFAINERKCRHAFHCSTIIIQLSINANDNKLYVNIISNVHSQQV